MTPEPEPESEPPGEIISGRAPRATGGFPSVVLFTPEVAVDTPLPEEPALLDQYNTDFHPELLVVRVGQTVHFKNSEDTLHNVHVIDVETRETAFNVATPVQGTFEFVFERASVYDVSCGIHPSMAAFIIVSATPYVVTAANDGAFSVDSLPHGTYRVRVWNLDPERRSEQTISIDAATRTLSLDGMS